MLIRLGTRGSKLALAQSIWVKEKIESLCEDIRVEIVKIKTKGDKILDSPLSRIGGKGLFVKEIEVELIRGNIDIAVHSMKDVPVELPEEVEIASYPKRENPFDAFVSNRFKKIDDLPDGSKIGTSSLRRKVQIKRINPSFEVVPIRGNVDTRLRKLEELNLDAIIIACAGLIRLNLSEKIRQQIPEDVMIPAIGQGALAIEIRRDDERIRRIVSFLNHKKTEIEVKAERAFLKELGGGCQIPIAGHARIKDNVILIRGMISDMEGKRYIEEKIEGDLGKAEDLGKRLAEMLIKKGARKILEEIYGR